MTKKTCKFCGSEAHTQFYCSKRPRKALKIQRKLKSEGKHSSLWKATRREWILQNPPDHAGYYYCYICSRAISKGKPEYAHGRMTLDHIKSRSRYPELRYQLSNLAPCCHWCNSDKGSLSLEEYLVKKGSNDN